MPCSDPRDSLSGVTAELRDVRGELDDRTAQLCKVMQFLDEEGLVTAKNVGRENVRWWEAHKEADRKRKASERRIAKKERETKLAKKRGLAKLTPKERKALGV